MSPELKRNFSETEYLLPNTQLCCYSTKLLKTHQLFHLTLMSTRWAASPQQHRHSEDTQDDGAASAGSRTLPAEAAVPVLNSRGSHTPTHPGRPPEDHSLTETLSSFIYNYRPATSLNLWRDGAGEERALVLRAEITNQSHPSTTRQPVSEISTVHTRKGDAEMIWLCITFSPVAGKRQLAKQESEIENTLKHFYLISNSE